MVEPSVVDLRDVGVRDVGRVGGKGAHLGELTRAEGVDVPPGFCVTTDAYRRIVAASPAMDALQDRAAQLDPDDRAAIGALAAEIRTVIEAAPVAGDIVAAITGAVVAVGEDTAWAVRSSATAEDMPTASSAGQQDTFLNVIGPATVVSHVRRCWASLFTDRAVTYRLRNGIGHRSVRMAVVVQRMAAPRVSGVLFTADPVTSNRTVTVVEACFGLGEALVSGLVDPDSYTVRDDAVVATTIATKRIAVHAAPAGGTEHVSVEPRRRRQPTLTAAQARQVARIGRRIEAHLGQPQDVEWCLGAGGFEVLQSRPITTLFPVPPTSDGRNHVYVSVGHQQMMTDPMKPLGLAVWQLTALRPMHEAGNRLFVDVTDALVSPAGRSGLMAMLGRSDPLIGDALQSIVDRGDFLPVADGAGDATASVPAVAAGDDIETDPAIVAGLIAADTASIAELRRAIVDRAGTDLLDFIAADLDHLRRRRLLDPVSNQVIMAAMEASWWLDDRLEEWLGERRAADALTLSAPNNITSQMGLALMDVADVIRPLPDVVAFLRDVTGDDFLDELAEVPGGRAAHDAITAYLDRYGMRCAGEIDITRPRWSEQPTALVPLLLGNVDNLAPGEAGRRFEDGRRAAHAKEQDVLRRLRELPGGPAKAAETTRMIDRVRTFIGYREHPKYAMVSRYFIYKQALLGQAQRLVDAGALAARDDIFFLRFDELRDVVRTGTVDAQLIATRQSEYRTAATVTPPRVLTSDGEALTGRYRRDDVPAGALTGLAVSAGTVEGRARIVVDMAHAAVEPGDILVTAFTDPSWSPLFVAVAGLVTEVGGLMTHGAVIAREYGLPAVVGVEHATRLIRDGQRIRVHGADGYVEILGRPETATLS